MEIENGIELNSINHLSTIVWDYVYDQVITLQNKIVGIRIESLFAVLRFLKVPKWRYRELIDKVRIMSKYYHLKGDITEDWKSKSSETEGN